MNKPVNARTCRTCVSEKNPSNPNSRPTPASQPKPPAPPPASHADDTHPDNKRSRSPASDASSRKCSACAKSLPATSFSQSQYKRPANKRATCAACLSTAAAAASTAPGGSAAPPPSFSLEPLMDACGARTYLVENGRASPPSAPPLPRPVCDIQKAARREQAYRALLDDLRSDGSPSFLGVDCEGTSPDLFENYGGAGAILVQVSSRNVVVVEALTDRREQLGGGLSDELRAIVADPEIALIFCDAKGDVKALNAEMAAGAGNGGTAGAVTNIIDVQNFQKTGGVKTKAGLAAVLSSAVGVGIGKQSIKKNKWWRLRTPQAMVSAKGFVK